MDSPNEKLALGLERLAKAGSDPDLLGLALQSIHGALEDAFRQQLASDPHVPEAQRAEMLDPKRVQWKALLDAMTLYRDLSSTDAEVIGRWNTTRNRVAHGGRFSGAHAELDAYAVLAQRLPGYAPLGKLPPAPPAPAQPARSRPAAGPAAPPTRPVGGRPERAPTIPRAVRAGAAVPARSGPNWLVIMAVVGLLGALALLALVRGFTTAPADAAATRVITAVPPPAPTASLAATPATSRAAIVVAEPDLKIRTGPALDQSVLFYATAGTRLAVVGGPVAADGYSWWQIELDGRQGWCAGEFLRFEE